MRERALFGEAEQVGDFRYGNLAVVEVAGAGVHASLPQPVPAPRAKAQAARDVM